MNGVTLQRAYQTQMSGLNQPQEIPLLIWLLENPDSPLRLPGNISLLDHDCLHVLLDLGVSAAEEAFILGFTMGSDLATKWLDIFVFKLFSRYLYPRKYQFTSRDLILFDRGFHYGRSRPVKYLNRINFQDWLNSGLDLSTLRSVLGINLREIKDLYSQYES